jgi:hypothetical protein
MLKTKHRQIVTRIIRGIIIYMVDLNRLSVFTTDAACVIMQEEHLDTQFFGYWGSVLWHVYNAAVMRDRSNRVIYLSCSGLTRIRCCRRRVQSLGNSVIQPRHLHPFLVSQWTSDPLFERFQNSRESNMPGNMLQ